MKKQVPRTKWRSSSLVALGTRSARLGMTSCPSGATSRHVIPSEARDLLLANEKAGSSDEMEKQFPRCARDSLRSPRNDKLPERRDKPSCHPERSEGPAVSE